MSKKINNIFEYLDNHKWQARKTITSLVIIVVAISTLLVSIGIAVVIISLNIDSILINYGK